MSSDLAISARGLTKRYRIRVSREGTRRGERQFFTALDHVDLDIGHGEVVGILGRNGAGKSTLLKVLSRITAPDEGFVDVWGRVGSLLEVGTGFHGELTGRENVYLNGSVLGMRKPEINALFDEIVEFAEIGAFIDTPVKRYSSGMHVRLAFSVAAHLNAEILIVDEVLAVGDARFQSRCLGKMNDVALEQGRTVLFVSHNMASIRHLCARSVVLKDGAVDFDGQTSEAIAHYLSTSDAESAAAPAGNAVVECAGRHVASIMVANGDQPVSEVLTGQEIAICFDLVGIDEVVSPMLGVRVRSQSGQTVFSANTRMKPVAFDRGVRGRQRLELHIPDLPLVPGHYPIDVDFKDTDSGSILDRLEGVMELRVVGTSNVYGTGVEPRPVDGLIYVDHFWTLQPEGRA